jgi:hypothetical protein
MLANLPYYISIVFALTTFATLLLFVNAIKNASQKETREKANVIALGLIGWLIIQAIFSLQNVYNTNTYSFPPKIILLGILPTFLAILLLFITTKGKQFIVSLPIKNLTYLNTVRVPVEVVLFWLFINKTIPELMTFEGRNFDILAGITAPIIAYLGFRKTSVNRPLLLIWNFVCLGLLINIVLNALFAAPTPVQKFAFDQPNIAILYFPFSWLPTFIVPIVLLGHLISIKQLLNLKQQNNI